MWFLMRLEMKWHWTDKLALVYTTVATGAFTAYLTHYGVARFFAYKYPNVGCVHAWAGARRV